MKTPSYHFGYIYIILIRIFAILTLLSAIVFASILWYASEAKIRSLRYSAPSAFIERYNNLASLMRMDYEFVMMLNNQAPIPDQFVDAKRYLAPLNQAEWRQEDFVKFRANLLQAGVANRALKEYLVADYCNTVDTFISEISAKLERAKSQITPPTPPAGQSAVEAPRNTPVVREKRKQYPSAPFLEKSGNLDATQKIREAEDVLAGLEKELQKNEAEELKGINTDAIERTKDYLNMFRQLLGLSIASIMDEKPKTSSFVSTPDTQYQRDYQAYLSKMERLQRIERLVSNMRQVLINNIRATMLTQWPTDALIPSLLSEIDEQERRISTLDAEKIKITQDRWGECAKPLGMGILIAFVLFVSADFLVAILDTARHTGLVAEYHGNDKQARSQTSGDS